MNTSFSLTSPAFEFAQAEQNDSVNELAIAGHGFLMVRDPASGEIYAAQSGKFSLDSQGYLTTDAGARLQGRTSGSGSNFGDIQINAPGTRMMCYSIDEWGRILVHLCDGTSFLRGQIMLQNFQDPQALVEEGDNLCSNISAAGPLPALAAPGSHGLGLVQWGIPELARHGAPVWAN